MCLKCLKEKHKFALEGIIGNHIYPTPPLGQDITKGQFLSRV